GVMITVIILSLLAFSILIGWIVARRRQRASRGREDLPLISVPTSSQARVPRPLQAAQGSASPPSGSQVVSARSPAVDHEARLGPRAPTIRTRDGAVSTLAMAPRGDAPSAPIEDDTGEPFEGASVR